MRMPSRAALPLLLGFGAAPLAAFQESGGWSVDAEPRIRVGWLDHRPETEFFDVVGAALLPDGALAIADRGLAAITVVEADGSLRFVVGGSGEGPGEFESLARLVVDDRGHLYAFDSRLQRLTEWTDAGDLVGTTTFSGTPSGRRIGTIDRFETGGWYGRTPPRVTSTRTGGLARDTAGFFRLDGDGNVGQRLASVPGMYGAVMGRQALRTVMFSPRALDARRGDCLLVMAGDEPEVRVIDAAGAVRGVIPLPIQARETTPADRQSWIDGTIRANGASPRAAEVVEAFGEAMLMAERFPIANRIVADEAGYVWLERYEAPEGPSGIWFVVDGAGEVVAEPALPGGLRLLRVGPDHVIGVGSDAFDRQEVRVHGLHRRSDARETVLTECRRPSPGSGTPPAAKLLGVGE